MISCIKLSLFLLLGSLVCSYPTLSSHLVICCCLVVSIKCNLFTRVSKHDILSKSDRCYCSVQCTLFIIKERLTQTSTFLLMAFKKFLGNLLYLILLRIQNETTKANLIQ